MPRQQVISRLARHFEVVWIEPPEGWRHYWLGPGLFQRASRGPETSIAGLTHYDPGRWLPEVYRPAWLRHSLARRRVRNARRLLERKGCTSIVAYLWRYEFAWALDEAAADLSCYHIDDEYTFSVEEKPNDPAEVELLRKVDFVIVHSPKLMEKKGGINPDTISVPNGVNYAAYSRPAAEPADLAAIPHPRMGYVGVVKTQLNFELLLDLSRRRPDWSFVLVGPSGYLGEKAVVVAELSKRPNVWLLGNRTLAELPGYVQHMDACVMCYEVNSYTNYIYPLKLHEYLATGRPVVSSPINSVIPFAGVVRLASSTDEWEAALDQALKPASTAPGAAASRQSVAAAYDWDLLVDKIASAFRDRLASKPPRSRAG